MSEEPQYCVVVLDRYERIKAKHGPMSKAQAQVVRKALKAKLGRKSRVEVRGDRKAYWKTYHANRYKNDPAYKERVLRKANDWNRKARAAAKGDITPWLE